MDCTQISGDVSMAYMGQDSAERQDLSALADPGLSHITPPSCITGVQNTQGALIDWLAFTFSEGTSIDDVMGKFGEGWTPMERGFLGYRSGYFRGGVKILYDGMPGMGVHVQMSGTGCRELERDGLVNDWPCFLEDLVKQGVHFTRIDAAIDDRSGMLDLDAIEGCLLKREFVSRFRKGRPTGEWSFGEDSTVTCNRGFSLGSRQSEVYVRFYDKALEQGVDGHWVRVEMEFKGDRAGAFVKGVLALGIGELLPGVLRSYVDFKQVGADSNRSRWATVGWWEEFLSYAAKLRLVVSPVIKSVDKLKEWLGKQVAPSLAFVVGLAGGDLEPLFSLVDQGKVRLRPWQRQLLQGSCCALET